MAAYFLSPFRGFEFLTGSLAAYLPKMKKAKELLKGCGLALITASLIIVDSEKIFPGLWALPPTLGTALVLLASRDDENSRGIARILSIKPLLFFGAISYSLYLWHWPVMAFTRILLPKNNEHFMFLAVATSIVLGWMSWRFVEIRFTNAQVGKSPILGMGLISMALVVSVAGFIWKSGGAPARFSQQTLLIFEGAQDYSPWRKKCHKHIAYADTCVLGDQVKEPNLVVWGDSHGTEISAALAKYYTLRQITSSACPPVISVDLFSNPDCLAANEKTLLSIVSDPAAKTVLLAMNYERYRKTENEALEAGYRKVVEELVRSGKQVFLMKQIPNPGIDVAQTAGFYKAYGLNLSRLGHTLEDVRYAAREWTELQETLAQHPAVSLIDPSMALCNQDFCPLTENDKVLYFNGDHVSMFGADRIAKSLQGMLPR